jgi:hypothetical protein
LPDQFVDRLARRTPFVNGSAAVAVGMAAAISADKEGSTMRNMLAVLALGFVFAGCGIAPEEEPLPVAPAQAAQANNGVDEARTGTSDSAQPEAATLGGRLGPGSCPDGQGWVCVPGPFPYCHCEGPKVGGLAP